MKFDAIKNFVDTALSVCGYGDAYIIDSDRKLVALLSADEVTLSVSTDDIEKLLNMNPICIIKNKYEKEMANALIAGSVRISSVPIVDKNNRLLYVYQKVNKNIETFVKADSLLGADPYSFSIWDTMKSIRKEYQKESFVVTDVNETDIKLHNLLSPFIISTSEIEKVNVETHYVVLAFLYDYNMSAAARMCIEHNVPYVTCVLSRLDTKYNVTDFFKIDSVAHAVLQAEAHKNSTYFDMNDFQNIFQIIKMTEFTVVCYLEIGTYRGDSARAALAYMVQSNIRRKAFFVDTFKGFSYQEANVSSDITWAGTHGDTSLDFVNNRLSEFRDDIEYELIQSNVICDALPQQITDIAVAYIDVDIFEATVAALDKVDERITDGGVIMIEDYGHTPPLIGAQIAVDDFYKRNREKYMGLYLQSGQYVFIRRG